MPGDLRPVIDVKEAGFRHSNAVPTVLAVAISIKRSLARRSSLTRPAGERELLNAEQIDLEDQRGARRDDAAGAARAIAQVRRNDQRALTADMHGGEAFVPARDDLALAQREGKRLPPVERAIELLALLAVDEQPARVIDRHGLAGLRHRSGARFDVDDAQATGRGDLAGGLGGLGSQRHCGECEKDSGNEKTLEGHEAS
jgi:hypothetical protein